jgi:hypothetical protein
VAASDPDHFNSLWEEGRIPREALGQIRVDRRPVAVYGPVVTSYVLPRIFCEGQPAPDPNAYSTLPPDPDPRGPDSTVSAIEARLYRASKS